MKALIYLFVLIAIVVLGVWFGYGVSPQNQWEWLKGYTANTSSQITEQISNTESSASKLKNRLGGEFNEAKDVYNGKEKDDPFQYNPQ